MREISGLYCHLAATINTAATCSRTEKDGEDFFLSFFLRKRAND
jgi:hypothetical protein